MRSKHHRSSIKQVCLVLVVWWAMAPILAATPSLTTQINRLIFDKRYKKTAFSVSVFDLSASKSIYRFRPERLLIPASNMKLVTTASALDHFGSDYQFITKAGLRGNDLVIVGCGNPILGDAVFLEKSGKGIDAFFAVIATALQKRHVTEIKGDIILETSLFDDVRFHPSWNIKDADKWYTAQVSALNYNDNCLDITFKPLGVNQRVGYALSPNTAYMQLINKCVTVGKGHNVIGVSRNHDSNDATMFGKCRNRQTVYVTVDRPASFFGYTLAEYLGKKGISIKGQLIEGDLSPDKINDMTVIATDRTTIGSVVSECNQRSLNLAAECLFKLVGSSAGLPGSWQSGQHRVKRFLDTIGTATDGVVLDDGSGLSRKNLLSTDLIVSVLKHMYHSNHRDLYMHSLATGQVGTLKKSRRFSDEKYRGKVFAKTGFIQGVWALGGYCQNSAGKWHAFSMIANKGVSARKTMDDIVKVIMQ